MNIKVAAFTVSESQVILCFKGVNTVEITFLLESKQMSFVCLHFTVTRILSVSTEFENHLKFITTVV